MWLAKVRITGLVLFIPFVSYAYHDARHLLDIALILPLALRRRTPVLTFTVICLLLLAQAWAFDTPRYGDVALLLALHTMAAYGPVCAAAAGLAACVLPARRAARIAPAAGLVAD